MKKTRFFALLLAVALSATTVLPAFASEVEETVALNNIATTEEAEVELPSELEGISEQMAGARETADLKEREEADETRATTYGDLWFNYDIYGCGFVKGTSMEISFVTISYGYSVPYYIVIADAYDNVVTYSDTDYIDRYDDYYITVEWDIPYNIDSGYYYIYGFVNGEIMDYMQVYVSNYAIPSTGLTLDEKNLTIQKGEESLLIAWLEPYGTTTDVPNNLKWSTSDSNVAVIEDFYTGEASMKSIVAKGYGSCTITVKYGSKYVAKCEVYVPDPTLPFRDVAAHKWFYNAVKWAYGTGLITGTSDTTFSPDSSMTRGMLVTVLYRAEGRPAVTGSNKFPDVLKGKYYEKGVVWASSEGIVSGYTNGKFGPDDSITREQLAKVLYRYAEYKGYDVSAKANLNGFNDASSVASYAKAYMQWAVAEGLIKGSNGSLNPKGEATRAEIAAILKRFVERYE